MFLQIITEKDMPIPQNVYNNSLDKCNQRDFDIQTNRKSLVYNPPYIKRGKLH